MNLDDGCKKKYIKKIREKFDAVDLLLFKINQKAYSLIRTVIKSCEVAANNLKKLKSELLDQCLSALNNSEVLIEDYREYLEVEDYNFILMYEQESHLESRIEDYFSVDFTMSIKLEPSIESSEFAKSFAFFEKNSKVLTIYDLLDMKVKSAPVESEDYFGDNAGWCRLPGRKVFQYGGQLNSFYPPLNTTYIIDIDSKTVSKKAEGPYKKYAIGVCAHIDPYVYIFGGSGLLGSLFSESEKYNLSTDSWHTISNLPFPSDYNSTVTKNNTIYVTGYQIGIFKYTPDTDDYTLSFDLNTISKILIEEAGNLYLITERGVFVSQDHQWTRIKKQTVIREEAVLSSYPVKRGNYVYFLMSDSYLFKFNLTTFEVERAKMLEFI